MGSRGPVPKRTEETLGHMTRAQREERDTTAAGAAEVEIPAPDEGWHPIAKRWFASLSQSGQSKFFEPSDWATAYYVAEAMHRHCVSRVFSAPMFVGIMSAASDLLSTEGSRRRMRLELQRPTEYTDAPVGVTAISNYKKRITG